MYRANRPDPNAIARARRAAVVPPLTLPVDAGIVDASAGDPRTNYPRTLWLHPAVPLHRELIPVGLNFLHHWHVAAPIFDYNTLAFQHGTIEERLHTTALIGDLRVPLYETRALFLRQCAETDVLLAAWALEREGGRDERLAFHRALGSLALEDAAHDDEADYKPRCPLILPLPTTWIEGKHV